MPSVRRERETGGKSRSLWAGRAGLVSERES